MNESGIRDTEADDAHRNSERLDLARHAPSPQLGAELSSRYESGPLDRRAASCSVRRPRRGDRAGAWCAHRVARSRRYSANANRERRRAWWSGCGERFASSRVELFHIDALDFDLRSLYGSGPVKIIGNLPYYAATALIAKYTSALSPASMLVLTLQWEVAERCSASPRTKEFGAMTICTSRRWKIRLGRNFPLQSFTLSLKFPPR